MNFDLFEESPAPASQSGDSVTRKEPQLVAIYADESCLGNGREGSNPGGAGGVIELMDKGQLVRWDYWVSEPSTTNNRMALQSVIEAFSELAKMNRPFHVVFTSDSRYIVEGMRSWVASWVARGWKRKSGPIENIELWKRAVAAVQPFDTQWNWVRGHNGQPQNEYANFLATRAAQEQSCSNGLEPSRFDEWIEAHRNLNAGVMETAPFPQARDFKPTRKVWTI